jgi:TrmH family RNA methyltransferase
MPPISSPQNERVKLVRLLQRQSKTRRQMGRLVLEGVRLIGDALDSGALPDFVLYTSENPAGELIERLHAESILCLEVTDPLMRDMADTETPQGILGVFPWPDLPVPVAPGLVFVADGWRDPGNLGTVLRTAAAAGVDLAILTPGTVDAYSPKTLRAGMGAHFRIPIRQLNWDDLAERFADLPFYYADADGDARYDAVDWTQPSVLVIGGEAHGFAPAAAQVPHQTIRIPMVTGAESLNAAIAASRAHARPAPNRTGRAASSSDNL